ncbi:MAG: DUF4214 domain-containing protein [Pseudomonadota bacterium]
MAVQNALITQIYIGYFNRAPDPAGLNYWAGQLQSGVSVVAIAGSFASQAEAVTSYAYLANPASGADDFLASIYDNLFDRAPDAAGLAYWKGELAAGKPVGRMIVDIISGAQGNDKTVIDNKVTAAQNYVDLLSGGSGASFTYGDARRVVADTGASAGSVVQVQELLQKLGVGNGLSISILDSGGTLAPYESGIRQSLAAAWDMWAAHFTRTAPIEIEVKYQASSPGVLAFAGSLTEVSTGEILDGRRVTQSGVGVELITGRDPNGATPDARITIAADPSRLVFRDSADDPLPRDKFDALSIFAHELGHVLGFRSNLDSSGRPIQPGFLTNYDKFVSGTSANSLKFGGGYAIGANGGTISLATTGPAHLDMRGDLMASSIGSGQIKTVGVLDVAVLKDLGLPVSLDLFGGLA